MSVLYVVALVLAIAANASAYAVAGVGGPGKSALADARSRPVANVLRWWSEVKKNIVRGDRTPLLCMHNVMGRAAII